MRVFYKQQTKEGGNSKNIYFQNPKKHSNGRDFIFHWSPYRERELKEYFGVSYRECEGDLGESDKIRESSKYITWIKSKYK